MVKILKILICGTRKKGYDKLVRAKLNSIEEEFEIIHGDCKDSADVYAQKWAWGNEVKEEPYPSTPGNYLKRNIEMVKVCDKVIAFWDKFSYGTCFVISRAFILGKPIEIVDISS